MKNTLKKCAAVMLTVCMAAASLAGCGDSRDNAGSASEHPVITITTRSTTDYNEFIDALHEVYPEINIELISYAGYNTSGYALNQLKAGDISDIFVVSYPPDAELQKENFIDLSGESFMNNINTKTLSDLSVDGAVYLVPTNMTLFGLYYNKTLFEKNGWKAPESLDELEALIPQIEAAGVKLAECNTQYTGATFSFLWDTAAGEWTNTLTGIQWRKDYLAGTATAAGNIEPAVDIMQHWIDLGLINYGETPEDDGETVERFEEGNTAFLITNSAHNFTQNDDGSGDQYGILPWLSADGSKNTVITNVNFYVGVSRAVADDQAKLEDVMKVMSFLTTYDGQHSLATSTNAIAPLANGSLPESSPLRDMAELIDDGEYMNLVYPGWEDYVVDIGESILSLVKGDITKDQLIADIDAIQEKVQTSNSAESYGDVTETLEKEEVAQLVGAAYAEATGSDCALISTGDYHGVGLENKSGVNGKLYKGLPLTSDTLSTVNAGSSLHGVCLMTLTGAKIKQYAQEGFYIGDDPEPFKYILVTRDGEELDDSTTYTVACSTESETRSAEGNLQETEIGSLQALIDYVDSIGTVNREALVWK